MSNIKKENRAITNSYGYIIFCFQTREKRLAIPAKFCSLLAGNILYFHFFNGKLSGKLEVFMANKVEELTINYSEDGVQKVRELDKHVLTRGAWSTIMYLYEDRTRSDEPFSAPKITIRQKIRTIIQALAQRGQATFSALLGRQPTRLEAVVTFLALLELVKQRLVQTHQATLFGEIEILPATEDLSAEIDIASEFGE